MMTDADSKQLATGPVSVYELIDAINNGQLDYIVELLEHRVSVDDISGDGCSPVHYAAIRNEAEILQLLLRRGFQCNPRDRFGCTPLHLASAEGKLDAVQVLLEASCSVNFQDFVRGNTAVHEAAWGGFSQTLDKLVKHKADVNLLNKEGFSALHLAAQQGHNESSRILLRAGCNPNHKNQYGDTALHTAARYGHAGVTRILLYTKECCINEQNKHGDTALHIAAALKQAKITRMLVEAGSDLTKANTLNERASDIARQKGHEEIFSLISTNTGIPPVVETLTDQTVAKQKKQKWSLFTKKNKAKEKTDLAKISTESSPGSAMQSPIPQRSLQSPVLSTKQGIGQTVSIDSDVILHSFQQYQMQKRLEMKQGTSGEMIKSMGPVQQVRGLLSQYTIHEGTQYYRDLAGNVRQGPIGYVPELMVQSQHACRPRPNICDIHANALPQTSLLMYPRQAPIQSHYDHLSYLRSRNTHLPTARYTHSYERSTPFEPLWPESHNWQMNQRKKPPQHPVHDEVVPLGRLYRSISDETLSTASSCKHPSARHGRHRGVKVQDTALKTNRARKQTAVNHQFKDSAEYCVPGRTDVRQESFDRHQRKRSQKNGQTQNLRKKSEKVTSTSSESGANSSQPHVIGNSESSDVPSRSDATSNPDSGYGGSKACLQGAVTSMQQLTISESSSFQSGEELECKNSEGKLTSSTDNASVVSSNPSGSVVSVCNSL